MAPADERALAAEHEVLVAMACGLPLPDVLHAIVAMVERRTDGTCRIEVGEVVSTIAHTDRTSAATVAISGEHVARVTVELPAPTDGAAGAVVARAATLVGMAVSAASRADRLTHGATHDSLTGLPNRVLLLDRLRHAVASCKRRKGEIALLYLDLDDFKHVNDRLGHRAGDQLLVEVGRRLAGCIREGDTAARLGGDEFAIVLDATDDLTAATVVRRVEAALTPPIELNGSTISIGASIGLAMGDSRSTADTLLDEADAAMYARKRSGSQTSAKPVVPS